MYTEKLMKRFMAPQNVGQIKGASGIGKVGNPVCGDIMKVYLKIENNIVTDAKMKTFGCAAAIVSADIAMDLIKGKTVEEAGKVTNQDVLNVVGEVPSQKIHCSILAKEAIEEAIKDYKKKLEKEAMLKAKK
ncbi:MAG: iron-sulfur cluster assembly scaffold protein [Christensenellaceae bacterium]|jgi:nitrogen fixation NifU-like protein|nr:iron-sulfur cluster assembly scaffold protein [Christensenellaceae bacterium]